MTRFEYAHALLAMWSAWDGAEDDAWGCKSKLGSIATMRHNEALEVALAMHRISVSKGILVDDEGKECAR